MIPTLVFIFFEEGIGQDRNFNWWRSLLEIIDDIIILIIPSISGLILHMDYYRRDLAFIFVSILITFLILLMMLHFKGYIESRYMKNTPKSFEEFAKMVRKILNSLPYMFFFLHTLGFGYTLHNLFAFSEPDWVLFGITGAGLIAFIIVTCLSQKNGKITVMMINIMKFEWINILVVHAIIEPINPFITKILYIL